jgi:hypothetical protein
LSTRLRNTCEQIGFLPDTPESAQCALRLYEGQQKAAADSARYQLELQRFQAEQARYAAAERERLKQEKRAKWEALQRFGIGMAQSQSPTTSGAIADGNAAMLGLPPARQNSDFGLAPQPPRPRTVTITTPNGRMVTCTSLGSMVSCI